MTDLQLVIGSQSEFNSTRFTTSFTCGPGLVAISGGAEVFGRADAALAESRPVLEGDVPVGWQATGVQSVPDTLGLQIWMVCVRPVP